MGVPSASILFYLKNQEVSPWVKTHVFAKGYKYGLEKFYLWRGFLMIFFKKIMANYTKLNKEQLLDLAREEGLEVNKEMTNKEIIALLEGVENTDTETDETEEEEVAPKVEKLKHTVEVAKKKDGQLSAGIYGDEEMYEKIKSEPIVKIFIPFDMGEKKGALQEVFINGCQFNILKGQQVDVPMPIAEVINNAMVVGSNQELAHLLQ